jgi:hypothetical protein
MTDRPPRSAGTPAPPTPPRAAPLGAPARGPRASERTRKSHPLAGAFPLAVMTLATFLVLFAVMMARLKAGVDPALRAGPSSSLAVGGAGAVRTRTSGGGEPAGLATPVAASEGASAASSAIVTRASGASGGRQAGDE